MPADLFSTVAAFAVAFGLVSLAGALLALRIRRRGMSLCLVIAGLGDDDLARLTPQKLLEIDDELHDCAKLCAPAAASAIGTVRRRVEHILARP